MGNNKLNGSHTFEIVCYHAVWLLSLFNENLSLDIDKMIKQYKKRSKRAFYNYDNATSIEEVASMHVLKSLGYVTP